MISDHFWGGKLVEIGEFDQSSAQMKLSLHIASAGEQRYSCDMPLGTHQIEVEMMSISKWRLSFRDFTRIVPTR